MLTAHGESYKLESDISFSWFMDVSTADLLCSIPNLETYLIFSNWGSSCNKAMAVVDTDA